MLYYNAAGQIIIVLLVIYNLCKNFHCSYAIIHDTIFVYHAIKSNQHHQNLFQIKVSSFSLNGVGFSSVFAPHGFDRYSIRSFAPLISMIFSFEATLFFISNHSALPENSLIIF